MFSFKAAGYLHTDLMSHTGGERGGTKLLSLLSGFSAYIERKEKREEIR